MDVNNNLSGLRRKTAISVGDNYKAVKIVMDPVAYLSGHHQKVASGWFVW
jgi:hypothetical protein